MHKRTFRLIGLYLLGGGAVGGIAFLMIGGEVPVAAFILAVICSLATFMVGRYSHSLDVGSEHLSPSNAMSEGTKLSGKLLPDYLLKSTAPLLVINSDSRVLTTNSALQTLWGVSKNRLENAQITFADLTEDDVFFDLHAMDVALGTSLLRSGELLLHGKIKSAGTFQLTWIAYPEPDDRAILVQVAEPLSAERLLETRRIEMIEALRLRDDDRSLLKELNYGLRTELQGVLGMIDLLKGQPAADQQQKYLQTLTQTTHHVMNSVDTFIDFFDIDETWRTDTSQGYSLDQLLSGISAKLNKRGDTDTFEVLYDTDCAVSRIVHFPRELLEKMICHLVAHLVQTGNDNCIVVRPRISDTEEGNPQLNIEVLSRPRSDDPQEISSIHDPEHISLDLEIARRLAGIAKAELQAGQFSRDGIGFKFTTGLVKVDEHLAGFVVPNYLKNLRALIIDDNPVSREVLQELTYEIGWQADVAASGEAALHMMKLKSGLSAAYDIVLVDWRMPEMDGWETSKKIRDEISGGALPIIVMISAHNQEFLSKNADERGQILNGFLTKPVSLSMLLDAVIDATAHRYEPERMDFAEMIHRDEVDELAGTKILVVDDNLMNQEVAKELLSLHGAKVITASGGYGAITAVQNSAQALDLVLMDIHMPDLDGLSTAKRIRELGYRSLPIIMMTAHASNTTRDSCFKAGAQDLVQKPFMAREIVETITSNINQKNRQPIEVRQFQLSTRILSAANEQGFDIAAALKLLDGNLERYASGLENFQAEGLRIRNYLKEGLSHDNFEDVPRKLTTLGGMMGLIGVTEMGERAKAIALKINDGTDQISHSECLADDCAQFVEQLDHLLHSASILQSYLATELGDRRSTVNAS